MSKPKIYRPTQLEIRENQYPAGGSFRSIYIGSRRIGSYSVLDNGFLPHGCKKILTEREAQFKVIQRYIAEQLRLAAEAAALYDLI